LTETQSIDLRYLGDLLDPKLDHSVKSLPSYRANPKLKRKQYSQNLQNELQELNRYLDCDFKTNQEPKGLDQFSAKSPTKFAQKPPYLSYEKIPRNNRKKRGYVTQSNRRAAEKSSSKDFTPPRHDSVQKDSDEISQSGGKLAFYQKNVPTLKAKAAPAVNVDLTSNRSGAKGRAQKKIGVSPASKRGPRSPHLLIANFPGAPNYFNSNLSAAGG
jgi:hypothetical protein